MSAPDGGDVAERRRAVALAVAGLARTIGPHLRALGIDSGARLSRSLWPRGAPGIVSWAEVFRGQQAGLERSMDELVRSEREAGGGSVAPRTLARQRATTELLAKAASADGTHETDGALASALGEPARRTLAELLEATVALWLRAAATIEERDGQAGTLDLARMLLRMMQEALPSIAGALRLADSPKEADAVEGLVATLRRVAAAVAQMPESDEPAPAMPAPSRPSAAEARARLARVAAAAARVVEPVAAAIDRVAFAGAPPAHVTWEIVDAAIATRFAWHDEQRAELGRVATRCDQLVVAPGSAPFATASLVRATADALQRSSAFAARGNDADAQTAWTHAKMLALNLVVAGQLGGHEMLVAPIAADIGMDTLPFGTTPAAGSS